MKIKIITTIITIITLLPLASFAQFDFNLDNLFMDETDIQPNITIVNFYLIWSADTYVPYEYQGRALPSPGSKITVEAIVNAIGGTSSLKYSWFVEDIFQSTKSGYGRNILSFYANQRPGGYQTIRVQIFNEDRTIFDEKTIKIPVIEPEVVVHLRGDHSMFSDRATKSSVIFSDKKLSFVAKPYFFSIKKLTDLTFEWRFAGHESTISSAYGANVLELNTNEKKDSKILEQTLGIEIENKTNSFQKALQTIKVQIY